MPTPWSGYDQSTTLLSTQLNSLANSNVSAASAPINLGSNLLLADIQFVSGGSFTPTDGGCLDIWLLRSIDGAVFEDGGPGIVPARTPDATIGLRAATAVQRGVAAAVTLPTGTFCVILRNASGAALPATGNVLRMAAYSVGEAWIQVIAGAGRVVAQTVVRSRSTTTLATALGIGLLTATATVVNPAGVRSGAASISAHGGVTASTNQTGAFSNAFSNAFGGLPAAGAFSNAFSSAFNISSPNLITSALLSSTAGSVVANAIQITSNAGRAFSTAFSNAFDSPGTTLANIAGVASITADAHLKGQALASAAFAGAGGRTVNAIHRTTGSYRTSGLGTVTANATVPVANLVFSDDFTTLSFYDTRNPGSGGTWQPARWYSPDDDGYINGDSWMVNPFNPATPLNTLYTQSGSNLVLGMNNTPTPVTSYGSALFVGSQLQTALSFARATGYWECRAAVPSVPGAGFAFWLINDSQWPPEIDITETVTVTDGSVFAVQTLWNADTSAPAAVGTNYSYDMASPPDLTQMHTYGCEVTDSLVTFFIDRIQTGSYSLPAGYGIPLFVAIDYSSGDSAWLGPVDPASMPKQMQIDYVKCWAVRPF